MKTHVVQDKTLLTDCRGEIRHVREVRNRMTCEDGGIGSEAALERVAIAGSCQPVLVLHLVDDD